tara:strand:+ start:1599 stop:2177 length:579 start_codon:yes stop_codon:yes gene_type:complete
MIIESFFPTMIYGKDVNLDINLFEKEIVAWSKKDPGLIKTNVNGWHSKTTMHKNSVFKPLVDELYKMQQEVFHEEFLDRFPKLGNMWANINYKDSFNKAHMHANSHFSGVYYVKVPKDSGRLVFSDPRLGARLVSPKLKSGEIPHHKWKEIYVDPKENRIIMFPSWLEHLVENNKTDNARISVSFNFVQDGF